MYCNCKDEGSERHACPFQEDVNGNDDPEYCNCCDDCKYNCAMDI